MSAEQTTLFRPPPVQGDGLFDALVEVWAIDPAEITRSARVMYDRCAADLRAVGTTPATVQKCSAWFSAGPWRRFKGRP